MDWMDCLNECNYIVHLRKDAFREITIHHQPIILIYSLHAYDHVCIRLSPNITIMIKRKVQPSQTNPLIQLIVTVAAFVVGGVEAHGGAGNPHALSNSAGGGQHENGRRHDAYQYQCHVQVQFLLAPHLPSHTNSNR